MGVTENAERHAKEGDAPNQTPTSCPRQPHCHPNSDKTRAACREATDGITSKAVQSSHVGVQMMCIDQRVKRPTDGFPIASQSRRSLRKQDARKG